jgi:hypothetical protein
MPGSAALVLDTRRQVVPAQPALMVPRGGGQQQVLFTLVEDCKLGKAGEQILMAVTPADVSYQQEELDTYLGGYRPDEGFAADLFCPVVLVDKEKARRRDHSVVNAYEVPETRTGRQGTINEITHLSATLPYETEEHALAAFIPWAAENDAMSLYNVRASHSELISDKLGLAREVRVWGMLTTLTNWNSNNRTTLTTNYKWDNGSSKNPRADLHARIKASAGRIRRIGVNPDVAFYFLSDTEVRAYMKQMMGNNAPEAEVAYASDTQGLIEVNIVGYPPISICPAKRVPAAGGALEYILGNHVVLVGGPRTPPRDGNKICSAMTLRTRGRSGTGWTTNEYVPNGRGLEGGTMFEAGYKEVDCMPSNIVGGFIKDVLS